MIRPVFRHQPFDHLLPDAEIRLLLDDALHFELVGLFVGLGPGAVHRRPLAAVEHAELDARGVDRAAHLAAERVDLADDLPLGHAADGRVAAHLADGVEVHGQERGLRAESRRGQRRLAAGMAGPDDDDIEIVLRRNHPPVPGLRRI